jgi:hypothetical protein
MNKILWTLTLSRYEFLNPDLFYLSNINLYSYVKGATRQKHMVLKPIGLDSVTFAEKRMNSNLYRIRNLNRLIVQCYIKLVPWQ